jgi:hypothetical protein
VGNPYRRTAEICRLRLTFGGAERQTKKIKEDAEFRGFFDLSSSDLTSPAPMTEARFLPAGENGARENKASAAPGSDDGARISL